MPYPLLSAAVLAAATGGDAPLLPSFMLPLNDLGSGQVSTILTRGVGIATFTRATSATCWGSNGRLLTVAPGVPRSTYTELTGTLYEGYLSEEARTNNCLDCRDLTTGSWLNTGFTALKDQTGIDGTAAACTSLLATAANAIISQNFALAAVSRPFSVYVKRLTGTGNIDLSQDGVGFTTQAVANDGLYHRITLVASQLNASISIRVVTSGDKIAVDYVMYEDTGGAAATIPTTPILTTTVAVTRNKDSITYSFSGLTAGAGTIYSECKLYTGTTTAARNIVTTSSAADGTLHVVSGGFATTTQTFRDGTNVVTATVLADLATASRKSAVAFSGVTVSQTRSGAAIQSGTFDGGINTSAIGIGCDPTALNSQLNGAVKNIQLWSARLTDAQLIALTT